MTTPANRPRPGAYLALHRATDGLLREIVELHHPTPHITRSDGTVTWWQCEGCDLGSYPVDRPDWPCETAGLIAQRTGVPLADLSYSPGSKP